MPKESTSSLKRFSCAAVAAFVLAPAAFAANTTSTGGSQSFAIGQPGLGLNYAISTNGVWPGSSGGAGSEQFLGEIRLFAFDFIPGGWMACNGNLLLKNSYTALYSLLGTFYGGDGLTTFALPDLRGRTIVSAGSGVSGGLSVWFPGDRFGAVSATLPLSQIPSHAHTMGIASTGTAGGGLPFPLARPSLAVSTVIAPNGVFDSISEIRAFGGNFEPTNWMFTDGRVLSTSAYSALFSRIGTFYGGNGSSTFKLPELSGRASFGEGQAPGLAYYALGAGAGAEGATIATTQLPAHTHGTAGGSTGSTGSNSPIDLHQPTRTIHYIISLYGVFPSPSGSYVGTQPYVGEIRAFAGTSPPSGWMFCEGQLLPISENETLFVLIGTTFGGDGQYTFGLPDLRGRVPVGTGTGPGLPTVFLADTFGGEQLTLTTTRMPAHLHAQPAPEIDVRGNGVSISDGDTTPASSDDTLFPASDIAGPPVTRTFTVRNNGQGDLTVAAILSGSAKFTLVSAPAAAVAPGGNTTFQVQFSSTSAGDYGTSVQISNEDPDESLYDYTLRAGASSSPATRYPSIPPTLLLAKGSGGAVDFSWTAACGPGLTGYALYEGTLGSFSSHALVAGVCNTAGLGASATPSAGDRYFLASAVDTYTYEEGSLGQSSSLTEAVHPAAGCQPVVDLTVCP